MSVEPGPHCGHVCCNEPHNPLHSHFLDASECLQCGRVRREMEALHAEIKRLSVVIADKEDTE